MGKKSKVFSFRADPRKLEILKQAKIEPAHFFRRSLQVFEEQWRLKNYGDHVKLGEALAQAIKLESLEAERRPIVQKLEEFGERLYHLRKLPPLEKPIKLSEWIEREEEIKAIESSSEVQLYKSLKKKFEEMLDANEPKITELAQQYLQSLTKSQIETRCQAIDI